MAPPLRTSLALLSVLCLPICTQAHMQMSSPYPIRSPLDPDVSVDDKDYSMTSPLLHDGSNFPCKNYQNWTGSYVTKATYVSGGSYDMWLNGTVMHDGGSCQISLSYDNGATFKVIKSFIGGCPLDLQLNFTVPEFAPSSDSALLSWSWFSLVGNRDMYQNCARVKIISAPAGRQRRGSPYRRQASSMDQLPDMFACNIGNGCQTIERSEVVFPNPGSDVVYGQDAVTPDPGPGYVLAGVSTTSDSTTATSSDSGSTSSTAVVTTSYTTSSSSASTTSSSADPEIAVASSTTTDAAASLLTTSSSLTTSSVTTSSGSGTSSSDSTSTTDSSSSSTTSTSSLTSTTVQTSSSAAILFTEDFTTFEPLFIPSSSSTSLDFDSTSSSTTTSSMPSLTTPTSTPTSSSTSDILTDGLFFTESSTTVSMSTTDLPLYSIVTVTVVPLQLATSSSEVTSSTTSSTTSSASQTSSTTSASTDIFALLATSTTTTSTTTAPTTFLTSTISATTSSASTAPTAVLLTCPPGATCEDGQITRQNAGACTPSGQLFCNGERAFYLCDDGGLVDMGPVAPGTACQDGVIGFA